MATIFIYIRYFTYNIVFISFPNMNGSWTLSDERDNNLIDFYQYTVVFLLNEESVKKLIENKTFENLILLLRNKE